MRMLAKVSATSAGLFLLYLTLPLLACRGAHSLTYLLTNSCTCTLNALRACLQSFPVSILMLPTGVSLDLTAATHIILTLDGVDCHNDCSTCFLILIRMPTFKACLV